MNYFSFLFCIFFGLIIIGGCCSTTTNSRQNDEKSSLSIKSELQYPLGKLLKMEVEVCDGDLVARKEYKGLYLFKVKAVEGKQTLIPILIRYRDDTGNFPTNDFELYKYKYGRDTGSISSDQVVKMKNEFVGKTFNVVAYETGEFTGFPEGYFDYHDQKAGTSFHFQNYLVVVANLTKPHGKGN